MARQLNKRQKDILDRYISSYTSQTWFDYDKLPQVVRDLLDKINWYETLWSDVNRYLYDKQLQRNLNNINSRYKSMLVS